MNELVKIVAGRIGDDTVPTINARDLHDFLDIASEFRNWIKNRISDFGFVQGVDFVAGKFLPGSEQIDYHLTLDMAKELSMVERTPKGREVRRYFIEYERIAKAKVETPLEALTARVVALENCRQLSSFSQPYVRVPASQSETEIMKRWIVGKGLYRVTPTLLMQKGPGKLRHKHNLYPVIEALEAEQWLIRDVASSRTIWIVNLS